VAITHHVALTPKHVCTYVHTCLDSHGCVGYTCWTVLVARSPTALSASWPVGRRIANLGASVYQRSHVHRYPRIWVDDGASAPYICQSMPGTVIGPNASKIGSQGAQRLLDPRGVSAAGLVTGSVGIVSVRNSESNCFQMICSCRQKTCSGLHLRVMPNAPRLQPVHSASFAGSARRGKARVAAGPPWRRRVSDL
jgi:hypothetical protein